MILYKGDCLDVMGLLPDQSVDMILCDLPYGITKNLWDTPLPLSVLWEKYNRIIKPTGIIALTANQPFSSELILSNKKQFKYEIVWEKNIPTGFLNARRRPLKNHESILIFSKKLKTYNPQMTQGKPYKATTGKKKDKSITNDDNINSGGWVTENSGLFFPRSVVRFDIDRGLHPTQKPVALMEYLIKTYTNEGDLVLDNCMGSGTTGVACINTGRDFIGIEKDEKYFNIACTRLKYSTYEIVELAEIGDIKL